MATGTATVFRNGIAGSGVGGPLNVYANEIALPAGAVITVGTVNILSAYVPTSRTVNGKALSSDITLGTADVADSSDKRYVTDAQKIVLENTSGANTGDETESTIKTKLGITTLSGSNTGDETESTIKTKLGITTLSGSNTGDQDLSGLVTKITGTTNNLVKSADTAGGIADAGVAVNDSGTGTAVLWTANKVQSAIDSATAGVASRLALPVADLAALKALDTTSATDWPDKILINVESVGLFRLDRESAATPVTGLIVDPTVGAGQWIKMSASINDHNNMYGIQGGTTSEYYHLTSAQNTWVGGQSGTNTGDETESTILSKLGLTSISGVNTGDQDLSGLVVKNTAISGATKTKITYDEKGLVTAGADATTADIAASTDKNYVTDAQAIVIGNTSGTNTGDETESTIKTKLGITTLSGSNTGDQDLSGLVVKNAAITAGTNTKITYDAKGLVTGGTAATTADIAASTDKNYVTDAQAIVIGNTSGINTGDQDLSGLVVKNAFSGTTTAATGDVAEDKALGTAITAKAAIFKVYLKDNGNGEEEVVTLNAVRKGTSGDGAFVLVETEGFTATSKITNIKVVFVASTMQVVVTILDASVEKTATVSYAGTVEVIV